MLLLGIVYQSYPRGRWVVPFKTMLFRSRKDDVMHRLPHTKVLIEPRVHARLQQIRYEQLPRCPVITLNFLHFPREPFPRFFLCFEDHRSHPIMSVVVNRRFHSLTPEGSPFLAMYCSAIALHPVPVLGCESGRASGVPQNPTPELEFGSPEALAPPAASLQQVNVTEVTRNCSR
jgi:hypothetical protein